MKLFTPLFALLTATSVYSFEILKRDNALNVSPECQKDIDAHEEFSCLGFVEATNFEKVVCPIINTEKCQNFLNSENPMSLFPNCQNEKVFEMVKSKNYVRYSKELNTFACSVDGSGKSCPAAQATLNGLNINEYYVEETCKSKKCTIALKKFFGDAIELIPLLVEEKLLTINSTGTVDSGNEGMLEIFKILKSKLNSSECAAKAKDDIKEDTNVEDAKSGSNSITKIGASLLLSIGLILPYL